MTRRKSRSYRIQADAATIARLGAALVDDHKDLLDEGWVICATSGLWRTNQGTLTIRIAYRHRGRGSSLVHTIRGIDPSCAGEAEARHA